VLGHGRRRGGPEEARAQGRHQTQPWPGHTRKSGPQKKKRFQRKAARKRRDRQEDLRKQWQEWDALPPEVKKMRPELQPKLPRPTDDE
jgi:hypothetical protein